MSKIEKLLTRLYSKPKDFTYQELKTLLEQLGFIEYNKGNRLLTRSMNDAVLTTPNSYGEIKIDKTTQKHRIDPCDAVICAHKVAMGTEVEEITADQSVKAYLKMFGGGSKDE